MKIDEEKKLKLACQLVENICRSLGQDCIVTFHNNCVTVAPPSWQGESTGMNLFEALEDATK